MEIIKKANGNLPRTDEEKKQMIEKAAEYYGGFLTALGFDWKADPHSDRTPHRVAKAWVNDLIAGSISEEPEIKDVIVVAPVERQGFRDPKEVKAFQSAVGRFIGEV